MKKNWQKVCKEEMKSGFTITEVSITMAFIGSLLIFIAVVTSNILALYQKGAVIKAVNNVGRSLIDDFDTSINAAPTFSSTTKCNMLGRFGGDAATKCAEDGANKAYSYNVRYGTDDDADKQYGGVFCTGSYSYIWNTAYGRKAGENMGKLGLKYWDGVEGATPKEISANQLTLVKVKDSTRRVCTATMDLSRYDVVSKFSDGEDFTIDITRHAEYTMAENIDDPQGRLATTEVNENLLSGSEANLLLYELTIFPPNINTASGRAFYSGTFILATERGGINITNSGDYCQNIDENGEQTTSSLGNLGAEFNYCAINKFNFAARTAGK